MPEETVETPEQTNQPTPFHEQFQTPGVRELMEAKGYKDVEALGLAYYSVNKLLHSTRAIGGGKDAIPLPGEDAKPEDWDKVFTALGRPDSADKYDLKFDKDVQVDEPFSKFSKTLFHDMGLSPARAQKAVDKWTAFVKERASADATAYAVNSEKAIGALKSDWRGGDFDADVAAGQRAIRSLGLGVRTVNELERASSLAGVMELFAKLGRRLADGSVSVHTADEAAGQIAKLRADKAFQESIRNKRDPQHRENLKTWEALHASSHQAGKGTTAADKPIVPPTGDGGEDLATLTKDAAFQASLRDPKHPLRKANLARWERAHEAKYPTRKT